ncbi:TonB-dependent receptor [Parachitinimonas caeni]|uniref:TonB-dependent receptor n=1 Tax=Parachitinimonas caeni TaxID=3031301 RepID=A0ABT7DZI1_9NEIS|nr:TonB-dependent receptor [Parachitinimonas caeni]MDK2124570.1 TonB-dependent receptor [Parachitinimonas caeni]
MKMKHIAYAISILGLAGQAFAADEAPATQKPEKITVTGSHIKRIAKETVSPVTIMTREDIDRSGATTVVELMRKLTAAGGNGGESLTASSFRNGATSVDLRSLPTLILLNGYRLPASGSDSYSGETAVDLNAIPVAAIERVDVLKDGASALYGTDAVGGVINFILRKDYQGFGANAYYGQTTHGDGQTTRASVTAGFGDRNTDRFNANFTFSIEDRKAVHAFDRDWARGPDFRDRANGLHQGNVYGQRGSDPGTISTGGSQRMPDPECRADRKQPYPDAPEWFASPNRNACMYAVSESEDVIHPYKRYTGVGMLNWDVSSNVSVFAQAFVNHYDLRLEGSPSWIQDEGRGSVLFVSKDNKFNPYGKDVRIRRLFQADEGGTRSKVDTLWLVAGGSGQIGRFDWNLAAGHAEEKGDIRTYGTFMHDKLHQYLKEGKYNPFGGNHNSPDVIRELTADHHVNTNSKTDFITGKVTTEVGELGGGPIGVAVGAEWKRDQLSYDPSQAWRDGAIGIYSILRGISGSQKQHALFSELNLPFLETLEGQVAVRYDKYEFAGDTTNPKIGLRWTPLKNFMMRTSWGTGFRAPTLSQTFSEGRGGFAALKDGRRCIPGAYQFDDDCTGSALSVTTGSKDVKPEKSETFNLGFVFEPTANSSMGLTYWRIEWKDRISSLDTETVLAGENGSYKNSVIRHPWSTEDEEAFKRLTPAQQAQLASKPGRLKEIRVGLINRDQVLTDGFDIDGSVRFRLDQWGTVRLYGEGTYLSRYNRTLTKDDPEVNCDGNRACDAGEFRNPRWLAKAGINWDIGAWKINTVANYTSGYRTNRLPNETINANYGQYEAGVSIASSTLFDASVSYSGFKNATLRLGVDNMFDRDPPFYSGSNLGFDTSYGSARGRYIYGSLSYQFK